MKTLPSVAFIGLGVMGYPMAGHIAKAGFSTTVYNRTAQKAAKWVQEFGGKAAPSPGEAASGADFVLCCVGNDDDLRGVTLGEQGAFKSIKAGAVFIDHTTASAEIARELADHASEHEFQFLDAPVSGGQAGAEKGALTVMIGGDEGAFTEAEPIIKSFSHAIQHMGTSGAGQLAKMVNQICIAGVVQGLAEGMSFAKTAGLDIEKLLGAVGKGAAGSWQMDNRGKTMTSGKFDFGFAVDWMRKDLSICLAEAKRNGASLPVTAMIDQFYADVQRMGGGRWDTSSLILRLLAK